MYYVKYGSSYLHNPETDNCIVLDLSLTASENTCGYCDFTIYPDNPSYDLLSERDSNNPITVYDGDTLLFAGFIYELGKEFYLDGKVKCKGDLAYLNETILRPYSTRTRSFGNKAPAKASEYFAWLITQHNAAVTSERQFTVGTNQADDLDAKLEREDSEFYRENDNYPTVWGEITDKLIGVMGGYIRIRYDGGIRYIDYLSDWTDTNTQKLEFGVNLTDLTLTDNSESMVSYIVPLGAQQSDTKYTYSDGYSVTTDTTPSSSKSYYVHSTNYTYAGSITSFKSGTTYYEKSDSSSTYTFTLTTDTTPVATKGYYIMDYQEGVAYTNEEIEKNAKHRFVVAFESDKLYYEQTGLASDTYVVTSDTTPNSSKEYYTSSEGYTSASLTKYNHYVLTSDKTPVTTKGYYKIVKEEGHTYTDDEIEKNAQHRFVTSFEDGYLYYELTSATKFTSGTTYYEYSANSDQSSLSLTISGLTDGMISGETDYYKLEDKIYYKPNYDKYGWIGTTCSDTDITTKEKLLKYGLKQLKDIVKISQNVEIKAVDMHLIDGSTYTGIKLGEYVHIVSEPHGIDTYLVCNDISLDLSQPENSTYSFGDPVSTLTMTHNKSKTDISSVQASVSEVSSTLDATTETANTAATTADTLSKKTVKEFVVEYAQSSSSTTAPSYGWSKIAPEWAADMYVWQRIVTVYTDSTVDPTYSTPTCIQGANGEPGEPGAAGASVRVLSIDSPSYTRATWDRLSTKDYSNEWLSVANASEFNKDDIGIVNGTISDQEDISCQLYGKVTDITETTVTMKAISFIVAIRYDGLVEFVDTEAGKLVKDVTDNIYVSGTTKINGGIIETGSVSCDVLSGGTITGQSIDGGTIQIGKNDDGTYNFSVDSDGNMVAKTATLGTTIPTRNLLPDTWGTEQTFDYLTSQINVPYEYLDYITINTTTATVSFWAKSSVAGNTVYFEAYHVTGGGEGRTTEAYHVFTLTAEFKYYTFTWTLAETTTENSGRGVALILPEVTTEGMTFTVKELMLVEGSTPAYWTPSTSDISVSNIYKSGTTYIDGGKIYTGSLSASTIKGGTIDASDVTITNLNASNIKSGTIDASDVTITNLNASNITSGTISGRDIEGSKITGGKILQKASADNGGTVLSRIELKNGDLKVIDQDITDEEMQISEVIEAYPGILKFYNMDDPLTVGDDGFTVDNNTRLGTQIEINTQAITVKNSSGSSSIWPTAIYENGTSLSSKYLGINAKAASASTADNATNWTSRKITGAGGEYTTFNSDSMNAMTSAGAYSTLHFQYGGGTVKIGAGGTANLAVTGSISEGGTSLADKYASAISVIDTQMLGWSVPTECPVQNYVDSNRVFHQKVDRVDLGSLTWIDNGNGKLFYASISSAKVGSVGYYKLGNCVQGIPSNAWDLCVKQTSYKVTYICTDGTYTASTLKTYLSGIYLYYELATEITTNVDGNEKTGSILTFERDITTDVYGTFNLTDISSEYKTGIINAYDNTDASYYNYILFKHSNNSFWQGMVTLSGSAVTAKTIHIACTFFKG